MVGLPYLSARALSPLRLRLDTGALAGRSLLSVSADAAGGAVALDGFPLTEGEVYELQLFSRITNRRVAYSTIGGEVLVGEDRRPIITSGVFTTSSHEGPPRLAFDGGALVADLTPDDLQALRGDDEDARYSAYFDLWRPSLSGPGARSSLGQIVIEPR